jgi:hypothetical protein
MRGQLQKDVQALLRRKFLVKIAIGSVGFRKAFEFANRFLHTRKIPSATAADQPSPRELLVMR